MNPTPGTVGNLARRIPDDLGRLVDRDYGSKNVDPGPPTGDCVEDIARTIAWYEELAKAGFPTGDAEARLDEVLERCKPEPAPEMHDPEHCACHSASGIMKTVVTWKRVITGMRTRPNIDLLLDEPGDPIDMGYKIPPGGLTHKESTSEVPEEWILLRTKITWGTMFDFAVQGADTIFYDDYSYTWGCLPLGKNTNEYPEIDDRRDKGKGHQH
jgi:hypothetical protein